MRDYIDKNYAKKISKAIKTTRSGIYLIILQSQEANQEKLEVLDSAAQFRGTSLHDQVYSSLDILNSLIGVLM